MRSRLDFRCNNPNSNTNINTKIKVLTVIILIMIIIKVVALLAKLFVIPRARPRRRDGSGKAPSANQKLVGTSCPGFG